MDHIKYSVVIPVFNAVATLEGLYRGIVELMQNLNATFEVIFVEDRGRVESWEELCILKQRFPENIIIIRLSKNFGQNSATLCGVNHSQGQYVLTLDDDLQIHPREFSKLIEYAKNHDSDVVYGQRDNQKPTKLRERGGRVLKHIFQRLDQGGDIGSSFRLIAPSILPLLKHHSQDHLYINQVISWYTLDIAYVKVEGQKREEGVSNYSFLDLIKIGFRLIFYYSSIPLKLISIAAVFCAFICFFIALYYVYKKLTVGAELGFTATIVSIFTVAGIILMSISVLGAYVNRIYNSRIKKPPYHIKTIK